MRECLRRAYFRLIKLNHDWKLFTFCDPAVIKDRGPLSGTTNQSEGGVNVIVNARSVTTSAVGGAHEAML